MNWEEASTYILQSESGTIFKIKIEEGEVSYLILDDDYAAGESNSRQWESWCMAEERNEYYLQSYTIMGNNPDAGPPISLAEKVCMKIKLMERRWLSFQGRKHDV